MVGAEDGPARTGVADPLAGEMDLEITVAGARGSFEREALIDAITEACEDRDATLQAFDPGAVYGAEHLEAAARRAVRAHEQGRALARDLAVEVACYAAGTTQIDDALATVGVPSDGDAMILCALGDDREAALKGVLDRVGLDRDDTLLTEDPRVLERLGISKRAREAVPEDEWGVLVLEHVALLDALR